MAARRQMAEVFPELQDLADSGRADAQALVGGLALEYIDDVDAALRYFRMAAAADHPAGQRGLGHMLAHGIGTRQNIPEATELFEAAAKSGDAIAAFNLGGLLLKGTGVPPEEGRAVELLQNALAGGVPEAAILLADWHADRGEYAEARNFYVDAANAGSTKAMLTLGKWFADGVGGGVDKVEAVRWLLKPIDVGDGDGVHEAIQVARTMVDGEIREAAVRAGRPGDADALISVVRKPA
ncbi:tetratricopeptide repeat protein [Actinomadura sp. GC306]|uniref:tetratricopeptide repeat protein n=1 Tax=Actinomadura sp. GC306 TaxID=2530367 RepID=UPI0014055051|nr:tetratricopeptide repeat protein [Actinomadura sp. GC306]